MERHASSPLVSIEIRLDVSHASSGPDKPSRCKIVFLRSPPDSALPLQSPPTSPRMEHLEGRQSVLAALRARQRKFQVILISHGAHMEKLQELLDLAAELNVPIKSVDRRELDAMAHG